MYTLDYNNFLVKSSVNQVQESQKLNIEIPQNFIKKEI